jgi:hypothetical protein
MAGRRKGTDRELRSRERARRRRAVFLERMAAADTPSRRLSAAVDYFRTVAAISPSEKAETAIDAVVVFLTTQADALAGVTDRSTR